MYDKNYMLYDNDGTAVTADANGTAFNRLWMPHTPVVVRLSVGGTISGTSPTMDVKIQGSDNGTDWTDIKSFTQVTTSASEQFIRILCPYKLIRAVLDAGGTSPSYGVVRCSIVPAGQFTDPK